MKLLAGHFGVTEMEPAALYEDALNGHLQQPSRKIWQHEKASLVRKNV